jgi:hypothetical protein
MFGNIIKALSFILLLSSFFYLKAQDYSSEVSISHNTFYGLNDKMPFYFWANRMGQIPLSAGTLFTTQAAATGKWNSAQQHFGLTSGFKVFHSTGDIDVTRFTEAFATFSTRHIVIGGGLYADSIQQAGLSVSNGNLLSGTERGATFQAETGYQWVYTYRKPQLQYGGFMGRGLYGKRQLC